MVQRVCGMKAKKEDRLAVARLGGFFVFFVLTEGIIKLKCSVGFSVFGLLPGALPTSAPFFPVL